jgi:hypothetical protein
MLEGNMRCKFWLLTFLFLAIASPSFSTRTNEYWISYSGDITQYDPLSRKYLMKIDVVGNVVIQPKIVVIDPFLTLAPGNTALSENGSEQLVLWLPGHGRRPESGRDFPIRKATITKSGLSLASMESTTLKTRDPMSLSVAQRSSRNFLVLQRLTRRFPSVRHDIVAYSTTNPSTSWLLTECDTGDCTFNVSADGRMFFYSVRDVDLSLFLQPLGPGGRPVGDSVFIARGLDNWVGDITRPLRGGKRYCIYEQKDSLFLQAVQARSGKKIGERIRIAGNASSVVIDPFGQFAVYISRDRLFYQALDALGNPSGTRKLLVSAGVGTGLDILKD